MTASEQEKQWLLQDRYGGMVCDDYYADVQRLAAGEPLAYVIEWVEFLDTRIDLSERPLIPRPETEFWLEQVLQTIPVDKQWDILDMYSGSGCIGLAVGQQRPVCKVVCSDIADNCIRQIEKNIDYNALAGHCVARQSDGFANISGQFDLIFANPPYIAQFDQADQSVTDWEPHGALFADDDGLAHYRMLAENAGQYLKPDGALYIEFAKDQHEQTKEIFATAGWQIDLRLDQYGVVRWACCYKTKNLV